MKRVGLNPAGLRFSHARYEYRCSACDATIKTGQPYFRHDPHPMARRHRGERPQQLCTVCAVGQPLGDFLDTDPAQLRLAFERGFDQLPGLLFQTEVLELGEVTTEGRIVAAVATPWFHLIRRLAEDPQILATVHPRRLEEIVAGAYERAGWDEVTITPASRDRGRDIIAVRHGLCRIRVIDQVKRFRPDRVVSANDVRALIGVLSSDLNVSKGFVTTTARFAPEIRQDPSIAPFVPYRLELRDGAVLRRWLMAMAGIDENGV